MFRALNWQGILFGVGAGLVVGLMLTLFATLVGGDTFSLVLAQLIAFIIAGYVAGRFSLVGALIAGGFAGLILYFGLAVVAVLGGSDVTPVAILLFGIAALALGTAGAFYAEYRRVARNSEND